MSRTSAPSAPLASPYYYERLGHLQHGLRDSEKKRLDLERKLYEYSQSETCRVKLKYVKLKKYLKEICESEKKAHIRNQKYLKCFEHVQIHTGHFATNSEKLQELKGEYETQIKKMQLLSKGGMGINGELKDEDREKVAVHAGISSRMTVSRAAYQPAAVSGGRQTSAVSSLGDFSTEQRSPQPTKNFSIPDPHSCQQTARSSNVTDSCVVQTNSDTECLNKPDKIDGKTSLQIDDLPHGDQESQRTFRKMQEEQEEESTSSSSDLTVSVSEDDLILRSPEPQPSPWDKVEEDGIKALKLIHSEHERDAIFTKKTSFTLQSLRTHDSAKELSINSPTKESEQLPHSDLLKAQLRQHITSLDQKDSSLKEEAAALLKKALTEECVDRSSIHSKESSCSLPSILNDNSGIKEANHGQTLNSVHVREQETKIYQLLKQPALHDNTHQNEARFQKASVSSSQLSGLDIGSSTFKTKTTNKISSEANFPSNRGSPLLRYENEGTLTTNLKSKGFWGESDDSDSEIEAALRPRNHNSSSDDFDD